MYNYISEWGYITQYWYRQLHYLYTNYTGFAEYNCLGVFIIAVNMEMLCFCIQSTPGSSVVDIGGVSVKSPCAAPHPQRQQHCRRQ